MQSDLECIRMHAGKVRTREVIAKSIKFQREYCNLKDLVSGLKVHGYHNIEFKDVPEEWKDKLLRVLPPIRRRGMFYQIWEVL
ncbi:hypothetical protein KUA24_151 [Vibrio phage HNL01]|nr:hypothetical protein KUA24_151 [Vibrio phage HNL01]